MFHRRAMKNTIILCVTLILVFSTLVIAILAASATTTTQYLSVKTTLNKNILGDSSDVEGNYVRMSHTHDNSYDSYSHVDSYMVAYLICEDPNGEQVVSDISTNYGVCSITQHVDTAFLWNMYAATGTVNYHCGFCDEFFTAFSKVYND